MWAYIRTKMSKQTHWNGSRYIRFRKKEEHLKIQNRLLNCSNISYKKDYLLQKDSWLSLGLHQHADIFQTRLKPHCRLSGKSPTIFWKGDNSHELIFPLLQVTTTNTTKCWFPKCIVRDIHTIWPHEWSQCSIRSIAIIYLQVHWIIQSNEQRVCAKAVNSTPIGSNQG